MSVEIKLIASAFIVLSHSACVEAFELASESTMSSVVITAANSADDLINAASTPEGYGNGRYELMPFKTSISVDIDDIHDLAAEMDYAQVQTVEKQAESARQQTESNILAGALRGYLPESVADSFESGATEIMEVYEEVEVIVQDATQLVLGQMQQTINHISVGLDTISYEASRYLERFSAINIGFNQDDGTLGSVHISDMQSVSNVTITKNE